MFKANYHTHVKYCNHAVGDVKDYVLKAIEFGFEELGMTDHAPILEDFMSNEDYERTCAYQNMKMPTVDIYLNDIDEARKEYGKKIKILSGFESEFIESKIDFYKNLREKVEYLNLGIHFFMHNDILYDTYTDVNYNNLEYYVENVKNAIDSNLFNVLVHPDLYMFNYKDKNGNWTFDEKCVWAAKEILEYCIKNNIYVEINANGLKYSKNKEDRNMWKYPHPKFWEIAKEYKDLKILIGADAHDPNNLYNDNVKEVIKFAKDLRLKIEEKMIINH